MGFILVMKAEIVRSWIVMRRYWFRTLTGMVIGYGMLMVLIAGFMYSRDSVTEAMDGRFGDPEQATHFVLGFIIGMFAFGIVGMFSQGIQGMATSGVLEQLCMSPHGLVTNFLARCVTASFATVISSGIMLYLVTLTVGGTLHFDVVAVPLLLLLTFTNLIGFGFLTGGLTLVFKQVGQVAILVRMGLFGLAIFAREDLLNHGWALSLVMHALPITDAAICLKLVMIEGQTFADIAGHEAFYGLLANCVVWMTIGIVCFRYMEDYSRSKGTLGAY